METRTAAGTLDEYLQGTSPEDLGLLMAEIEHARKTGADGISYGDLIIKTARKLAREGKVTLVRYPDARRLFFEPLTPFLVDGTTGRKQRARIERASLEAIFHWLARDLMPGRFGEAFARLDLQVREGERAVVEPAITRLRADAAEAINAVLGEADGNERVRMRISSHVGGIQVLEDARDIVEIFGHAPSLDKFAAHLPAGIFEFDETLQKRCVSMLNAVGAQHSTIATYALALLMNRLDKPAQIIRLAKLSAGSDVAARLSSTPFSAAADLILHDVGRIAGLISQKLDAKVALDEIRALLRRYHALAHGLRTETEILHTDEWAIRLARASGLISERIGPIIASGPRHIKSALVPRREAHVHDPNNADLDAAEFSIGLMQEARLFISELALNDLVARTGKEVEQYMDLIGDFVVDRLRMAEVTELDAARALLRGTVRLTSLALGPELAELLNRSGNAALQTVAARSA